MRKTTPAAFAAERRAAGPRERFRDTAAAGAVMGTARGNPGHVLMAEMLLAVGVIGLRTIGQYEPRQHGAEKGQIIPSKGKTGPLPQLAATLIVFFLLALLAASGGTRARAAMVAGAVYDLAMLLNSGTEMTKLSGLLSQNVGKGKTSPGGGPGPGAGHSVIGSQGTPGGGAGVSEPPVNGKCKPGWYYDNSLGLCIAPPALQPITPF